MKSMTFEAKRICKLQGIEQTMASFHMGTSADNIQRVMNRLFANGFIHTRDFSELVKYVYGESDNESDLEYILCKILILYLLISLMKPIEHYLYHQQADKAHQQTVLANAREIIKTFLPEYKIESFSSNGHFLKYKPSEHQPVINNLKNIREDIADPIAKLLVPMASENELIGLISKVYMRFEKITPQTLTFLNKIDRSIYKSARELAKKIVNNVEGAKGHEGKSALKIKDIAHNFALNASLIQKLISLNEDHKETANKKVV